MGRRSGLDKWSFPVDAAADGSGEETEHPVQQGQEQIEHRHADEDGQPFEQGYLRNSSLYQKFGKDAFHRDGVHVLVQAGNGIEGFAGEQPDPAGLFAIHAFDGISTSVHAALIAVDGSDQVFVRRRGKGQGTFGPVAQLVEPGVQSTVQHDGELMRQDRRGLSAKAGVQIPHGRIMVALVFGAKKSEDRAARSRAPQGIFWRLGFCRLAGDAGQREPLRGGMAAEEEQARRKEAGQRHFHAGAVQHPLW